MYNASTNANFWHTTSYAQHQQPDVSGRYLVNIDGRSGDSEIYITDTVADQEFRVTNNSATQNLPKISAVYGGYILFIMIIEMAIMTFTGLHLDTIF